MITARMSVAAPRASRVLYVWLSIFDPGPINTLDSYVAERGRH